MKSNTAIISRSDKASDSDYDLAGPVAGAMIESLRAFGYDLQTAIADLIDNSISAKARNIWLHFYWDGEHSSISIRDDGNGMNEEELIKAMRLGSQSPRAVRDPKDLGRFGLGLKTASFSQCRLLTVHTRQRSKSAITRCWDLDYVVKTNEWRLIKLAPPGSEEHLQSLNQMTSGTIVLWQRMDRLVADTKSDDLVSQDHFLERADLVKKHLAMVFHDYMQGLRPIKIWINGNLIEPWDPFLTRHPATQQLPGEGPVIAGRKLTIRPYILPHHSKLDSTLHEATSGPGGWNAHQGFYIYRNKRLLVAGDWLGLGFQKEEHYKLARIRVDLPNSLDEHWHIDVKKSRAHPPAALRETLKRIARLTRAKASEIYRYRGVKLTPSSSGERVFLWEQKVRHGKVFYTVNREHPIVRDVLEESPDKNKVRALLRLIEETIPIPLITINNSEKPDQHAAPFEQTKTHEITRIMVQAYRSLIKCGYSSKEAKARLKNLEPFQAFPELLATIDELALKEMKEDNHD
jgi:Histidine kinase-, DNA gyrase B-, and HSP90-like ATPase.